MAAIVDDVDLFARVALVARAMTAALDEPEIVEIVVRQGMAALDAEGGVVAFPDAQGALVPSIAVGYSNEAIAAFTPIALDTELPLTVAVREADAVWVRSRVDAATRFPEFVARCRSDSEAWAALPLLSNGEAFGVLGLSFHSPRAFTPVEQLYIRTIADQCALALARCRGDRALPAVARVTDARDRAANHLFSASLSIANIVSRELVSDDVAARLHESLGSLGRALDAVRSDALSERTAAGPVPTGYLETHVVHPAPGVAYLVVAGELDIGSAAVLRRAVVTALAGDTTSLVVDVALLRFCDAAGIASLVDAQERANAAGVSVVVRNPSPDVGRVFDITEIASLVEIESSTA